MEQAGSLGCQWAILDANIVIPEVVWTVEIAGGFEDDDDFLLEDVERATITVWLAGNHTRNYTGLKTNAIFNLRLKTSWSNPWN
ncbi:hypothetical protein M1O51_02700 [Dehalococcoidia bacterium]|nr:hypothetical protein [Dehalococcoidia bacterium]